MPNLPKKGISQRKQKTDRHYWILHIQISLSNKFQVKLVILIFRLNFLKKGISGWKWEKWAWPLDSAYSSYAKYQISASAANFDCLDQTCPKWAFLVENRKIEHLLWILHRCDLGTKFQLKLTILIFWTKFAQKVISSPKQEKWT